MQHCHRLDRPSLFFAHYAYVDTREHLTDDLQWKAGVHFGDELWHPSHNYSIRFCKVPKGKQMAFLAAMQQLPRRMLLTGHEDYLEFCAGVKRKVEEKYAAICTP